MMRLEHANINVVDAEEALKFLSIAFPSFRERARGINESGTRWIHVGDNESYLCVNDSEGEKTIAAGMLNHIGFRVDDATAVCDRLKRAGYREGYQPEEHPHRRRVYMLDGNGLEYEFVEYLSEKPSEYNAY